MCRRQSIAVASKANVRQKDAPLCLQDCLVLPTTEVGVYFLEIHHIARSNFTLELHTDILYR